MNQAQVRIELRAAELAHIGPLEPHDNPEQITVCSYFGFRPVSRAEWHGWCLHYWGEYGGRADKLFAPKSASEHAGWLAREIWKAL